MEIKVERAKTLKEKPDQSNLGFGKYFTDHMFVYDWDSEKGWHDARIVPYAPIQMDPATMVLHYAQETFEGLKAYRDPEGNVQLFRPEMNAKRMRNSNKRLREFDALQPESADRTDSSGRHVVQYHLRRYRRRFPRIVHLYHYRCLHLRYDGGTDSGISRQEG